LKGWLGELNELEKDIQTALKNQVQKSSDQWGEHGAQATQLREKFDASVIPAHITWVSKDAEVDPAVAQLINPRPNDSWISDNAKLLEAEMFLPIDSMIQSIFENIGVEVGLITLPTLPGGQTADQFLDKVYSNWRIGELTVRKALLILYLQDTDQYHFSVGKGIQHLITPENISSLQTDYNGKAFPLSIASQELITKCEELLEEAPKVQNAKRVSSFTFYKFKFSWHWVVVAFVLLTGGTIIYSRWRFNRCHQCGGRLHVEHKPPSEMAPGELVEQRLNSVSHIKKSCPDCGNVENIRFNNKAFTNCPRCFYQTVSKTNPSEKCRHCGLKLPTKEEAQPEATVTDNPQTNKE